MESTYFLGAASNSETGVFASGTNWSTNAVLKNTKTYQFSTDTIGNGGDLSTELYARAGASGQSVIFFFGGFTSANVESSILEKYTISSNTAATGGSLTRARGATGAASNGEFVIICGGQSKVAGTSTVQKYNDYYSISSDTCTQMTDLTAANHYMAGTSSEPAHI